MKAVSFGVALFAILAAPPVGAAADDRSNLVTTLGTDTVAVETYIRTESQLEGDILLRVPATVHFLYKLTFAPDGSVKTSSFEIRPVGGGHTDDERRLSMDFGKDTVRLVSTIAGEQTAAVRRRGGASQVLFMGGYGASFGMYSSFGMYEHLFRQLKTPDGGAMPVAAFSAASGDLAERFVRRVSPTAWDVDFFKIAWTHISVDGEGRILEADATDTTEKTRTKRVVTLDLEKMEKEFVALDKAGKGVGQASPNVEAKNKVGDVTVTIRYGSPRLRGRTGVMQQLAAASKVWRTGANEATSIEFDRDLLIGGERIPAGKYTLFTLPTLTGVPLIVNRQTGQWGLEYKAASDVKRLPMSLSTSDTPVENFTIDVATSTAGSSELRMRWDTFVWSIPIASTTK